MPAHPVLPNPWYYLNNFQFMLDWVSARYQGLLAPEEQSFIAGFAALPKPSRGLLVRMVMRKGDLFRASKLAYAEVGDTQAAAPLLAHGWLVQDPALTADELFRLLTRTELVELLGGAYDALSIVGAAKASQCKVIREHWPDPGTLAQWQARGCAPAGDERAVAACPTSNAAARIGAGVPPHITSGAFPDTIYRVTLLALCDRLRLMFFGNLRQDWSEFVLADLGLYRYEQVAFPDAARAFATRQDIDDYLLLQGCRDALDTAADDDAWADACAQIPALPYANEWLESRRARLLFAAGQQGERRRRWRGALACYKASTDPAARARRIRVLEQLGEHADALALAAQALQQPASEAEAQAVGRMLPRLRRSCGHVSEKAFPRAVPPRLDLALDLAGTRVEEAVRAHLHCGNAPAFYVENTLLNSLFGLLCWDAIFASVPGAFFHPYQHGPADLLRTGFRERRAAQFEACLALLDNGRHIQAVRGTYQAKRGLQSPFVYWDALDDTLLDLALQCIPASHLRAVFDRLLENIRDNRSGLPDLIQFWPGTRRYRLIEVKGPGDRIQDNQARWLAYCQAQGIDICVCHVQAQATA